MVKLRTFEKIGDRVVVLNDPTFPLYLITGKKNILVDSGPAAGAPEIFAVITRILREISGKKEIRLHTLLLTHSHWDHTGGALYLQQQFGFEVLASQLTVDLLERPGVIRVIDELNQKFKKLARDDCDIRFGELKKLKVFRPGESIRLDNNSRLEIRETPGHTRCSAAFFLLPERILFPGDAAGLMEPDGTIRPLFFSRYPQYEDTIRTLLKLEAQVLALPHNRAIRGEQKVKSFLEDSLGKTREVREEIREYLRRGHDVKQTVEWIVDREFANISFMGSRENLINSLDSMIRSVIQAGGPKEPD